MEKRKYYLGLDVGTNSVGWAVTDENYNLVRAKGKDLWGVRLFQEAETAEKRRTHRSARRRTDRKRARLQLLRELFEDEINKVDPEFYLRLEESKYWPDDKKIDGKYSLFNDPKYTDKDYFTEYPTIFHLRKALMEGKTNGDIRLYFLAIHQMMKRRGHFIFEGQKFSSVTDVQPYIDSLDEIFSGEDFSFELSDSFYEELIHIVSSQGKTKTEKNNLFKKLIADQDVSKEGKKQLKAVTKLLVSGKASLAAIYNDEGLKEHEPKDVEFTGEKYELNLPSFEESLGERVEIIRVLKAIYDYSKLQDILKGFPTLSDSQISRYEKHREDLTKLKELIKRNDIEKKGTHRYYYKEMFKDINVKDNYVHYVGGTEKNGRVLSTAKCTHDSFLTLLNSKLKEICSKEDPLYEEIMKDIELGTFLQKQIVSTNSVIPYQIHEHELVAILNNLEKDFPSFLSVEDGVKKSDKIHRLFTFRIPYYVGPLNAAHKGLPNSNTWIVKKKGYENTKIRPWNFEKVVDLEACEQEFIRRMTNQCTYLKDQDVLPKSSIAYSKYMVYSELNNLKVNGVRVETSLKNELYNNLFLKKKRVTLKNVKDYLIRNNYADKDVIVDGLADDFKSTMSSYLDLKKILGENYKEDISEKIIEWITVHSSGSSILYDKLKSSFPELSVEQIKKLSKLKYADWGRFSEKFLCKFLGTDKTTGEVGSVLYFLKNTKNNLMELLSKNFDFQEKINEYNRKFTSDTFTVEMLEDLYVSPAVRKMIWQVLSITKEIVKVLGEKPDRIFLEMARDKKEAKGNIIESRKKNLIALYNSIKRESRDWKKEIESKSDSEFRSDKLFLYYTQMGRCMYSGEPIELSDLSDKNLYDIDHIIPRKLRKDDSPLNNKVLVKKDINQNDKKDLYPVPEGIRNKQKGFWESLYRSGFITKEKLNRLIRSAQLSDTELAEFINRQLVETRQSTKAIRDIFNMIYPESTIVHVKAGLVSEFRQDYEILKEREINDLHHAHDAFLNVVVGNGYYSKFTGNPLNFVRENRGNYTLNKIFKSTIKTINGKEVWNCEKDLPRVKKTINKPSVLYTYESYLGKGKNKGGLFNATIIGKNKIKSGTIYQPLKQEKRLLDVSKYGGYTSINASHCFIVEHKVKNKEVITVEFIPIVLEARLRNTEISLSDYCENELGLCEPKIIVEKVLIRTLIEIDGFRYTINGKTDNSLSLQPAHQPYWTIKETRLLKSIMKAITNSKLYNKDYCQKIDRADIIDAFKLIQHKLSKNPYKNRLVIPIEIEKYDINNSSLSNQELCNLIKECLNILLSTTTTLNLSSIKGDKMAGRARVNKDVSKRKSVKIIYQSITGIYEKEVTII